MTRRARRPDPILLARAAGRFAAAGSAALCLLSAGAACAQQAAAQTAQSFRWGDTPIDTITRWKPRADPPAMPDWVVKTRPNAPQDYQPLTAPAPSGPAVRTPEQIEALKSELAASARKNQGRAGRDFSVPGAKPAKKKPKRR